MKHIWRELLLVSILQLWYEDIASRLTLINRRLCLLIGSLKHSIQTILSIVPLLEERFVQVIYNWGLRYLVGIKLSHINGTLMSIKLVLHWLLVADKEGATNCFILKLRYKGSVLFPRRNVQGQYACLNWTYPLA